MFILPISKYIAIPIYAYTTIYKLQRKFTLLKLEYWYCVPPNMPSLK